MCPVGSWPIAIAALTIAATAWADPLPPASGRHPVQLAALPAAGEPATLILPPIVGIEPSGVGAGLRASSANTVKGPHFQVWPGYDEAVALHPYTSGLGPCPEGSTGSGCLPQKGAVIRPSRYERSPFSD